MIRRMTPRDLDRVTEIWLEANKAAHHFIPAGYWESNLAPVGEALGQAEVYVYEAQGAVWGFVGLGQDGYIQGLFVAGERRGQGTGEKLLTYCKGLYPRLQLHVYQRNPGAVRFYQRHGFRVEAQQQNSDTGETEYKMVFG